MLEAKKAKSSKKKLVPSRLSASYNNDGLVAAKYYYSTNIEKYID